MFCGKCGTENPDDVKFCSACGKPLGRIESKSENEIATKTEPRTYRSRRRSNNVASWLNGFFVRFMKIAAGCIALLLVFVIGKKVVAESRNTLILDKYVVLSSYGYNGYGTGSAKIDWDAVERDHGSRMRLKDTYDTTYSFLSYGSTPMEVLKNLTEVRLEKSENLSNGEEVAYTWSFKDDISKYIDYKIKYKNDVGIVYDLPELGSFDAFEDLSVEFSGISPCGTVNLNYLGSKVSSYDFSCDKTNNLSNGDVIKVYFDSNRVKEYAESLGMVPETLEKEYTVSGLDKYVTSLAEIDEESLAAMQKQACDEYNSEVGKAWGNGEKLESLSYIGDYLLISKDKENETGNCLYLVYKAQVHNTATLYGELFDKVHDVFWYIEYRNVLVDTEGKLVFEVMNYSTPENYFYVETGYSSVRWYYYGYPSLDDLYKNCVMAYVDNYNHEDNVVMNGKTTEGTYTEAVVAENGYILENSDTQELTKEDLTGLSAYECKLARNEIYARHGRRFDDEELQAYFDSQTWYSGVIDPADFDESQLSEIEIKNRDLIVEYEKENGFN